MRDDTRREEWARSWPVPLVAMLGIAGPAAYAYSCGIFMVEMTREFGWSRAAFSFSLTLQMLCGLAIGPIAGRILDRVGSRKMVLLGIAPFAIGLSLMGLASGVIWQWWLLAALSAILTAGVISPAWISGIVQSFYASRGLALSLGLAGTGVATALWPMLAGILVSNVGWRLTFPIMAVGWMVLALPLTYLFYRPANRAHALGGPVIIPPIRPILATQAFWFLLISGGLVCSITLALIVHFVPIVRLQQTSLVASASLAGLIGVFAIIGRIGMGALLDAVPTKPLAVLAFALPLAVVGLLYFASGSLLILAIAAALLGICAGAETDVVAYIASHKFDPRIFGSVYTLIVTGFAIFASLGPLLAGWIFDQSKNYDAYFALTVPIVLSAVALIVLAMGGAKDAQVLGDEIIG